MSGERTDWSGLADRRRLQLAAPDLLAALESMIEYDSGTPDDVFNAARSAIQKARGE